MNPLSDWKPFKSASWKTGFHVASHLWHLFVLTNRASCTSGSLKNYVASYICPTYIAAVNEDVLTSQQRIHLVQKLPCTCTGLSITLLHAEYSKEIYLKLSNLQTFSSFEKIVTTYHLFSVKAKSKQNKNNFKIIFLLLLTSLEVEHRIRPPCYLYSILRHSGCFVDQMQ